MFVASAFRAIVARGGQAYFNVHHITRARATVPGETEFNMILQLKEIQPEDRKHLHCSDPRIVDEVAAINRSIERLDEGIATWAYVDPKLSKTKKEVTV